MDSFMEFIHNMMKIIKKNLVITIPVKKLKELLNGEPTEQPIERVDTISGTSATNGEPAPEVVSENPVLSTLQTTGDTQVQQ